MDRNGVSPMSQATDTIATLRELLNREYARHQATIANRNRLRGIMTEAIDYTVPPDNWGGYCHLHHLQFPCPSCTSSPQPVAIPSVWGPPPPLTDPWMPNLSPLPPQPLFGFRFIPSVCEHCFCGRWESPVFGGVKATVDHEICCNCGAHRAVATHNPDAFLDD